MNEICQEGYQFSNWAKTVTCRPEKFFLPRTVDELRDVLLLARESNRKLRVAGAGHSPNDLVCTRHWMVSLKNLNRIRNIDHQAHQVQAECGIFLTQLNHFLHQEALSLPTQGSVSEITLGGAISVATHGSSPHCSVISGYVVQLELLSASGDLFRCSEQHQPELFRAALCGLGCIGILVSATIQCEPVFQLRRRGLSTGLADFLDNMHEFLEADYVKVNWYPHTGQVLVLHAEKLYDTPVTQYNWLERLHHWLVHKALGHHVFEFCLWLSSYFPRLTPLINRFFFAIVHSQFSERIETSHKAMEMDCLFSQHVNEWALPLERAGLALLELSALIENRRNGIVAHFPIEIRFARRDNIFLSPAYGRDTCYVNVILYRPFGREIPYQRFWSSFEKIMKAHDGRPHWAKAHRETGATLKKMYPNFVNWAQVRRRMDPCSLLVNNHIDRLLQNNI